jgi:hypothetical protein
LLSRNDAVADALIKKGALAKPALQVRVLFKYSNLQIYLKRSTNFNCVIDEFKQKTLILKNEGIVSCIVPVVPFEKRFRKEE